MKNKGDFIKNLANSQEIFLFIYELIFKRFLFLRNCVYLSLIKLYCIWVLLCLWVRLIRGYSIMVSYDGHVFKNWGVTININLSIMWQLKAFVLSKKNMKNNLIFLKRIYENLMRIIHLMELKIIAKPTYQINIWVIIHWAFKS